MTDSRRHALWIVLVFLAAYVLFCIAITAVHPKPYALVPLMNGKVEFHGSYRQWAEFKKAYHCSFDWGTLGAYRCDYPSHENFGYINKPSCEKFEGNPFGFLIEKRSDICE